MKKWILATLLLIIININSCILTTQIPDINDEPREYTDEELFHVDGFVNTEYFYTNYFAGGYAKIDKQGNVSLLCTDPLCKHDKNCPFFGGGHFSVSDKYLLFTSGGGIPDAIAHDTNDTSVVRLYDIEHETVKEVFRFTDDYQGMIQNVVVTNRAAFIIVDEYGLISKNKNGSEHHGLLGTSVFCYDIAQETLTKVTDDYSLGTVFFLGYNNHYVYWDSSKSHFFRTDEYFQNMERDDIENFRVRRNSTHYDGWYTPCTYEDKLIRLNQTTGEEETLFDYVYEGIPFGNRIFYINEPDPIPGFSSFKLTSDLYMMNADGTDQKIIYSSPNPQRIGFEDLLRGAAYPYCLGNRYYIMEIEVIDEDGVMDYCLFYVDAETGKTKIFDRNEAMPQS